jgi:hypothetical protein
MAIGRRVYLLALILMAGVLLACGAAWAATATFAPAKNYPAGDYSPQAVSTGDLDGDGDTDIATALPGTDDVSVLIRRSDGTFRAPKTYYARDPRDVIAREDLDGDGDLDLASANFNPDSPGDGIGTVSARLGRGDGTFAAAQTYLAGEGGSVALEIGDLDGDGDKDLVAANRGGTQVSPADCTIPGSVSVFLNEGDGSFAQARDFEVGKAYQPRDLYRSDLDGDGDEDLAVALGRGCGAEGTGGVAVLFNDGSGTFGAPRVYGARAFSAGGVVAHDLDADGDPDLAASDQTGDAVVVFKNAGDGTLARAGSYSVRGGGGSPTAEHPLDITKADLDGDGDTDIATANYGSDNVSVLANRGDGTFGPNGSARIFGVGDGPADVTRAPMNGDRRPDLVTANASGNFDYPDDVSVLLNTTR